MTTQKLIEENKRLRRQLDIATRDLKFVEEELEDLKESLNLLTWKYTDIIKTLYGELLELRKEKK